MSKPEISTLEWMEEEISHAMRETLGHTDGVQKMARDVLRRMAGRMGGTYVYIPRPTAFRRNDIRADFNGRNANQVADRYEVSVRTVQRIGRRNEK
jgi:Mor family transcriptional regulator